MHGQLYSVYTAQGSRPRGRCGLRSSSCIACHTLSPGTGLSPCGRKGTFSFKHRHSLFANPCACGPEDVQRGTHRGSHSEVQYKLVEALDDCLKVSAYRCTCMCVGVFGGIGGGGCLRVLHTWSVYFIPLHDLRVHLSFLSFFLGISLKCSPDNQNIYALTPPFLFS